MQLCFLLVSDLVTAYTQGEFLQAWGWATAYSLGEELLLVSDTVTAYTHAEQGVELCEGELPPGEKRDSAGAVSQRLEGFCPRFSLLPERGIYPRTCLLHGPPDTSC